jgi:hypothetical protein
MTCGIKFYTVRCIQRASYQCHVQELVGLIYLYLDEDMAPMLTQTTSWSYELYMEWFGESWGGQWFLFHIERPESTKTLLKAPWIS